jgi:ATP-dependent DNA helicase Rep
LYDTEDSPQIAAVKWTNVMEFCDWMAQRCGGQMDDDILITQRASKNLLDVAQNIALLSTLTEREKDQNVVTLSTLHAAKGLEWPHVMLVGVTEGMLPFKMEEAGKAGADKAGDEGPDEAAAALANADLVTRLQEERRLMYVGITRAQRTLSVSWTRRRKKGRDTIAAQPSRFIAEMALDKATIKEDPREKLRALRAEFAARAAAAAEKKPA